MEFKNLYLKIPGKILWLVSVEEPVEIPQKYVDFFKFLVALQKNVFCFINGDKFVSLGLG